MTLRQIKNLAKASYTRNALDPKKVNRIVRLLTRSELKRYLKSLVNEEKARKITVVTPKITEKDVLKKEIARLFPDKKIVFKDDDSLIAGVRVIDEDTVYDFNLKNRLDNLISYINE